MKRTYTLWLIILFTFLLACQQLETLIGTKAEPKNLTAVGTPRPTATPAHIGEPASDFTLPTVNGEELSLKDFRGKVVLVNFWATWCGPCREETPDLQRLYEKYQDQDFVIIGISVDDEETVEAVPDFVEQYALTYPILLDTDSEVSSKYEGDYIPRSYFIDAEGNIQARGRGYMEWDLMEGKALSLLNPEAGKVRLAALELVTEGRELAGEGKIEEAVAKFKEALSIDPSLELEDPQAEAQRAAARTVLQDGLGLASNGQIEEALTAYQEAQTLDPTLEISAGSWNNLCWFGSLWGHAADVLPACEQAVEQADPEDIAGYRDSRGVARSVTGDYNGAIEDFTVFVEWAKENGQYERYGAKREAWIATLETGQNPFDEETLQALLEE